MSSESPVVALFRPDDARMDKTVRRIRDHGGSPLRDPMLAIIPTGTLPPSGAPMTVFTSRTGVEIAAAAGWTPAATRVVAVGEPTADAAAAVGWPRPMTPDRFDSRGLAELIIDSAPPRVVIARSDHGSSVLPDALSAAGVPHEEVILYRLERPPDAGDSVHATAAGDVDALAFTSSLTVSHFFEIADEADEYDTILASLPEITVGAIGDPTTQALREHAIDPDCIPSEATADALIDEIFDHLTRHR